MNSKIQLKKIENKDGSELEKLLVSSEITVKQSLRSMDEGGKKILFIVNQKKELQGTLTDGDIRRWLLKEGSLDASIKHLYRERPITITVHDSLDAAKTLMLKHKIEVLPIIDDLGKIINAVFWDDALVRPIRMMDKVLEYPVLVMAGGKGARLDPFTRILPKPLIPVGEKPIVELIMDQFAQFGCKEFYLTVNYKGKMIQSYFENADCPYNVNLLWEERPLGTAGSIQLINETIPQEALFVTNCDILVKADFFDLMEFHKESIADITVVASMQHHMVPYGVIETQNGGVLKEIVEKPEYDFLVNTGCYVINKSVTRYLKENEVCDFPELINRVKNNGGKVCVYPVSEKSWLDAGQWQEYSSLMKDLNL